jgi:hypothetical protein
LGYHDTLTPVAKKGQMVEQLLSLLPVEKYQKTFRDATSIIRGKKVLLFLAISRSECQVVQKV